MFFQRESLPASAVLLALLLSACAEPHILDQEEPSENFSGRVLLCDSPDGQAEQGSASTHYAVDAMTRNLWSHPSFAKFSGLGSVGSCEEALAYVRAYEAYSEKYPDFDRNPEVEAGAVHESRRVLPELRIANSSLFKNSQFPQSPSPIVHLKMVAWSRNASGLATEYCDNVSHCTGTFIAKNWILTAAHCLQFANRKPTRDPTCVPSNVGAGPITFLGTADWVIYWAQDPANTQPYAYKIDAVRVYQFPHPLLQVNDQYDENYDLALLYVPDATAGVAGSTVSRLPASLDSGGGAMIRAYGLTPTTGNPVYLMAGYGFDNGVDNKLLATAKLKVAPAGDLDWNSSPLLVNKVIRSSTEPAACKGDSGGPLYYSPKVPGVSYPVVVSAVYSGWLPKSGSNCPPVNSTTTWSRVDEDMNKLNWIEGTMRLYNGSNFKCRIDGDGFYRCWGKPCGGKQPACSTGYTCVGDGKDYENRKYVCGADLCGTAGNDCSCLEGQCLQNPPVRKLNTPEP